MDTNLSSDPDKYLKDVPPEKVEYIFASMHIQQRIRFKRGVEKFFERAGKLKKEGHNIVTNYVLSPPTFERFPADFKLAKEHGIHLAPKPYKGVFEGVRYPEAYTEEQRKMFLDLDPTCNIRVETVPNYRGLLCNAGKSLIRVDPNGDIVRCKVDRLKLGNIYTGFNLFEELRPCRVNRCPCYGPERLFDGIDQEIPKALSI